MRTVVITIGLPGSGKSTWARQQQKNEPLRWKRVNKDDLRSMLDDGRYDNRNEKFVVEMQEHALKSALAAGFDVIVDNTSFSSSVRRRIHQICQEHGDVSVEECFFMTPLDVCLARNASRQSPVPPAVIHDMNKKFGNLLRSGGALIPGAPPGSDEAFNIRRESRYYPPSSALQKGSVTMQQDETLPHAILCDLDGTLALIGDRSPYDASDCDVKDKPNWPVIRCVLAMHEQGVKVIFMSGRDQKYRSETERFIEKYCVAPMKLPEGSMKDHTNAVFPMPYELHMRGETAPDPSKMDQRKDSVIKQELFDKYVRSKYNVLFVLDDRNQVVNLWRDMGLTCFQVAEGNF